MGTVAANFNAKALGFLAEHIQSHPKEEREFAHRLEIHRSRVSAVETSQVPSLAPKVADALLSMWDPNTKPPLFLLPEVVGWLSREIPLPPYWFAAGGPPDYEGRHRYQRNDGLEGPRITEDIDETPKGPAY